ncbi:Verru_Chthon cassette protein C [Verrucomicrobium spinosum]|uniref:Verru_Chthon cassette protein C n=1 Tax=Verrucomicrobium spinosum TaxID=2736 RepID=UPI00017452F2|nr:Verru_Chthon cassette protein C [Verrucomicrobium spinosum]
MPTPISFKSRASGRSQGFTLVELLVSFSVLAILLLVISSMLEHVQRAWRQSTAKVSSFREARRAFDRITHALSQADLNPYLCYRYDGSSNPLLPPGKGANEAPSGYVRYSELQFVSGLSSSGSSPRLTGLAEASSPGHAVFFQAPLGDSKDYRLPTSLNGCGFYIKFGDDSALRPDYLTALGKPPSYRYRMYEYRSPTERNRVYDPSLKTGSGTWYGDFDQNAPLRSRAIANNILMLVISPQLSPSDAASAKVSATSIAPAYTYDSQYGGTLPNRPQLSTDYQLPPLVMVTLVAMDEGSAINLQLEAGSNPPLEHELSQSSLFRNAERYAADMEKLSGLLVDRKVNFRVFTATVPIRSSKWGGGTGT